MVNERNLFSFVVRWLVRLAVRPSAAAPTQLASNP
jgi:hypothetical protein